MGIITFIGSLVIYSALAFLILFLIKSDLEILSALVSIFLYLPSVVFTFFTIYERASFLLELETDSGLKQFGIYYLVFLLIILLLLIICFSLTVLGTLFDGC